MLSYPDNKLHGSSILYDAAKRPGEADKEDNRGRSYSGIVGTIDYWVKLHTAGNSHECIGTYMIVQSTV